MTPAEVQIALSASANVAANNARDLALINKLVAQADADVQRLMAADVPIEAAQEAIAALLVAVGRRRDMIAKVEVDSIGALVGVWKVASAARFPTLHTDADDHAQMCWSCNGWVSEVPSGVGRGPCGHDFPDNCPHCGADLYAEMEGGTDPGYWFVLRKPPGAEENDE